MIRTIRRHASSWLSRRTGSQECLDGPIETQTARHDNVKTDFEITAMKTKQLLEKGKFQKVVEMLRELQHDFILKCLESFPFKDLNRNIPESFAIWETLLMKLHNNEDGYIPQFPYAACDELVLQTGRLLETVSDMPRENADLIHACKRVLKKVYMQYSGVLEPLIKEHERTEHAIYSLSLHLPLGTDRSAMSLHTAIKNEVEACMEDYQDALERLEDVAQKESLSLSQTLTELQSSMTEEGVEPVIEFHAPNPSQLQLQERLYSNQCIMRALEPNRRENNLAQLMEMLKKRIVGDKEVIALFGNIRTRNEILSNMEPVEPWLRKHQKAVECSIAMLKDIEKELEINIPPRPPSPAEVGSELSSSLEDTEIPSVSMLRSKSGTSMPNEEHLINRPPSIRRASAAAPLLFNIGEGEGEDDEMEKQTRRFSNPPHGHQRPRSASPMKFLRTNGISRTNGIHNGPTTENGSSKSLNSSHSSSHSLTGRKDSSSIHDLNLTSELQQPTQAFRRAQSLKAKGSYTVNIMLPAPQPSRTMVAGRKKAEATNLSTSTGNVSKSSKVKNMFRSGSGGLVARWDTQQRDDVVHASPNLFLELEFKNKELMTRERMIHDLQRRERELTDRLSDQAQRQLQDSEKFEDILLGASRATVVIQHYEELYTQARLEALDAIEAVQIKGHHQKVCRAASTASMDASDMFNIQLMLEVFKCAYQAAWSHLQQLHSSWRQLLGVPGQQSGGRQEGESPEGEMEGEEESQASSQMAEKQLESAITIYLRRVCGRQDRTPVMKLLKSQLDTKYFNHPVYTEVKSLAPFTGYMEECAKVAWGLCIQTPPMVINCGDTLYNPDLHKKFYNADKNSADIVMHMWPVLKQSNGPVLVRGIVLT